MSSPGPSNSVPEHKRRYWSYQYELGRRYLLPLLRGWGVEVRGRKVLELGCGEGGILAAMVEQGAEGWGLELSPSRANLARILAAMRGLAFEVRVGDLLDPTAMGSLPGPFDLVILRDVLEHVTDKPIALAHVKSLLRPGEGRAIITFPPFYSPFGGHQQMLASWFRLVPYWHFLPGLLFRALAAVVGRIDRQPHILKEMELFRRDRLSLGRFERLAREAGLRIVASSFYISRPSHHLRYGWPVIPAGWLGKVPLVREVLVSGADYLLAT